MAIKPSLMADHVRSAFKALGTGNEQSPPTNDPMEAAAWEFAIASELVRMANARKTEATKAAVAAGVLSDGYVASPGTLTIVHDGTWVQIQLKVNQPTTTLNFDMFQDALREHKVKQSVIDECKKAAMKTNKPPHQLTALFRSSRNGSSSK